MRVRLASNSPRRFAMLAPLFHELHQEGVPGVDETPPTGTVEHQVLEICKRKAAGIADPTHDIVVVADTMLSDPDDHSLSLGKPRDRHHATLMLHRMSGRHHQVWTATGVFFSGQWRFWCEHAVVAIQPLTDDRLGALLDLDSWKGKAGGYDLAGPMGEFASLVDGESCTVLGIAGEAMGLLTSLASLS